MTILCTDGFFSPSLLFRIIHSFISNCALKWIPVIAKVQVWICVELNLCSKRFDNRVVDEACIKFKYYIAATFFYYDRRCRCCCYCCCREYVCIAFPLYSIQFNIQHRIILCIHKQLNCNANWMKFRSLFLWNVRFCFEFTVFIARNIGISS